jgi:hypothetical protein
MTAEDNNKQDSLSDLYGIRFGGGNEYGHDNNKEEVVEESITLEADEEVNRYFGSQDNEYKQVNKDEDKEPSDRNGKIQSAADVLVEVLPIMQNHYSKINTVRHTPKFIL